MRVVLLGPPGAGKGTIAKVLQDELSLKHISTGDIFREELKSNSELGREIKHYVESGGLVPDEVVTRIVEQKLKSDKGLKNGYLLDGFPRTLPQAEDLNRIADDLDQPIDCAVYLEASLPVILKRLMGRRVCRKCGALYHMTNKPPKKDGICDLCGGETYQRADDKEETIKNRMDVYIKSTEPIIQYYAKQKKLSKVDADKGIEEIREQILRLINEKRPQYQNKNR